MNIYEAEARDLFRAFHGREPRGKEIALVSAPPTIVLQIGELDSLIYRASGDGKKYIHRFKKDARPVLAISHDGKQAYVLAGAYRFSDRGFEDAQRPRRKRRKGNV